MDVSVWEGWSLRTVTQVNWNEDGRLTRARVGESQVGNFFLQFTIVQIREPPSSNKTADQRQRVPLASLKVLLASVGCHFRQFIARAAPPSFVLDQHAEIEKGPDVA